MIYKKLIRTFSNMSFLMKLITSYSLLIIVSMSVMFYIQFSYLIPIIQSAEEKYEIQAFNQLALSTSNNYKKIVDIVEHTYNQKEIMAYIKKVSQQNNSGNDSVIESNIINYLNGVCDLNINISDFILITNDFSVYHGSSDLNRQLSPSYNFSKDKLVSDIRKNNTKMMVVTDNPIRYVINGSDRTVTFAGNLFDNVNLNNSKSIGTFIVNVSLNAFKPTFGEFDEKLSGELLVVDKEGGVLFSTNKQLIGEKYPYFDKLKNAHNEEILLDKPYIVNSRLLSDSDITILSIVPKDFAWKKLSGLRSAMFSLLIASLIITIIFAVIISGFFGRRIKILMKFMKKIQNGDLDVKIPVKSSDEIGKLSIMFNEMCVELKDYINRVYFAEIERKNSELATLQSQINPHFLFNTIESIRMKAVIENQQEISKMLLLMGNIFRWNIKNKDKFTSIENEIYYISSYLELVNFRFENRLEFQMEIPQEILDFGIPKLLLQPIVENSVVHGIAPLGNEGRIIIKGKLIDDIIEISVIDNGIGMEDYNLKKLMDNINNDEDGTEYYKIGMGNVNKRIKLIFGSEYGLNISSKKGEGTVVKIRIPAITKEEMGKNVQSINC